MKQFQLVLFFCLSCAWIDAKLRTQFPFDRRDNVRTLSSTANVTVTRRFDAIKVAESGGLTPAYPMGAAGPTSLIAIVKGGLESRNKRGRRLWISSLDDFFQPLNSTNFKTNTKIVYDTFEERFVVAILDTDLDVFSYIYLAVSKTSKPMSATSADWYYFKINSLATIGGVKTYCNYLGFEVDEQAIYLTANMQITSPPTFPVAEARVWIVDKGVSKGGFYSGGSGNVTGVLTIRNSFGTLARNYVPVEIRKTDQAGAGPGVGTYLVSSGYTAAATVTAIELVHVVKILDPIGNPSYVQEFVSLGDIENSLLLYRDAPQLGSNYTIEVVDGRPYDAIWHDNFLWLIRIFHRYDNGIINAYWVKLQTNATNSSLATVVDQGTINGPDIDGNLTTTYFPSVAVNKFGKVVFGFTASSPNKYVGAYAVARDDYVDAKGTVGSSIIVREGVAPYKRFFNTTRNSWGAWSGISIDPVKEQCFWVFNMFADSIGSCPAGIGTNGSEDGCWGTGWARLCVN